MSLKLINSLDYTSCLNLNGMMRSGLTSVRLPDGIVWKNICIKTPAQLIVSEKYEDNVKIYTATLKVLALDNFPTDGKYVFRIHLTDGNYLIMGSNDRPYPMVTKQKNFPDSLKDSQLDEVTIVYTSPLPIPHII